MASTKFKIENLILWAGVFPPDVALQIPDSSNTNVHLVCGKSDEYLQTKDIEEQQQLFLKAGFNSLVHFFEGGHKIDKAMLAGLFQSI